MTRIHFSKEEKFLLFILATVQFNHIVDFMILMPLGPQMMRLFQIQPKDFSLLVSSYTFCAGIAGFLASFCMDLFDRKKLLIGFFFGFCVGTAACGFADDYATLLIARSVTGFFGGVLNSLVLSIVSDTIAYEKRGSAMGIISTAFSLASIMGVPFALWISNIWGWHAAFYFLALLSVVVFALIFFAVPAQGRHIDRSSRKPLLDPLAKLIHTPNQLWALLFAAFLVLGQFMVIPFLSPSLVANVGLPESRLPLIYLVGGTATFFTGPLVGRLADMFGKQKIFIIGVVLSIIFTLVITNLGVIPVVLLLVINGFFFVSLNARWIPALAMISGAATSAYRGSFMSYVGCVQQLGAALGAMLAGMIVSEDAAHHILNFNVVGYLAVIISLLAFLLSWKVKIIDDRPKNVPPLEPA